MSFHKNRFIKLFELTLGLVYSLQDILCDIFVWRFVTPLKYMLKHEPSIFALEFNYFDVKTKFNPISTLCTQLHTYHNGGVDDTCL